MSIIAQRMAAIKPSPTIAVSNLARELQAAGRDVIGLGAGEPDFDTPDNVKAAAIAAIEAGQTKYTAVDGTPELKAAIVAQVRARERARLSRRSDQRRRRRQADHLQRPDGDPRSGRRGDHPGAVLGFLSRHDPARRRHAGDRALPGADRLQAAAGRPRAAITPRTKWLILNSPNNPTGAAYTAEELRGLTDVLLRHEQVWLLSDDIYEHLVYDDFEFVTPAALEPRLKDRCLTMNGVAKAYAMTGWRIGYAAAARADQGDGQDPVAEHDQPVLDQPGGGGRGAERPAGLHPRARQVFKQRRDLVVDMLNQAPGIRCHRPEGAFYVYPSCAGVIGRRTPDGTELADSEGFARYLLEREGVAAVHGAAFGLDPYLRISYATATELLEEACARIIRACEALR